MTNEERDKVIRILQWLHDNNFLFRSTEEDVKYATKLAIQELSQEPCDDLISRKEVIDTIYHECSGENLDIDFAKVLLLQRKIKALSSIQPKPNTGHWIADVDKWGDVVTTVNGYRCDKCNVFNSDKDNYCPNCGANMVEPQEGA